jgi:hypothetical protein
MRRIPNVGDECLMALTFSLQVDVGDGGAGGQIRVFRITLSAVPQRRAADADRRREQI